MTLGSEEAVAVGMAIVVIIGIGIVCVYDALRERLK